MKAKNKLSTGAISKFPRLSIYSEPPSNTEVFKMNQSKVVFTLEDIEWSAQELLAHGAPEILLGLGFDMLFVETWKRHHTLHEFCLYLSGFGVDKMDPHDQSYATLVNRRLTEMKHEGSGHGLRLKQKQEKRTRFDEEFGMSEDSSLYKKRAEKHVSQREGKLQASLGLPTAAMEQDHGHQIQVVRRAIDGSYQGVQRPSLTQQIIRTPAELNIGLVLAILRGHKARWEEDVRADHPDKVHEFLARLDNCILYILRPVVELKTSVHEEAQTGSRDKNVPMSGE